ncbi:MAG TPA: exonuclease subunit SbcD [Syntrophomonas sp.]|nr:exonuclease subunit SbcD [Syntrophomonas sp.]
MIKIRIAHIADVHQGSNYPGPFPLSKFNDIERILNWTADRIIAEQCDLCLIAGDCFRASKVMLEPASQEIGSIVRFLRKLSGAGIETIVISGTPSHDAVSAYELIKEMQIPKVTICTTPQIVPISPRSIFKEFSYTSAEPIGTLTIGAFANVACLPGLNRSAIMTQDEYKGLPPEQVHRIMTDKITQLCQGMSAQMPDDQPKILMAHMTYQSADKGFDDLLMQQEPILTREAVSGFDLVCLGHIHRPQQIDGKVFYSGPVERLSFNEEDINPGFWIHEFEPDIDINKTVTLTHSITGNRDAIREAFNLIPNGFYSSGSVHLNSHFIETPARRYVTIDLDLRESLDIESTIKWGLARFYTTGAIVRLHYQCTEEIAKQINRKELEKALYDARAFYVSEIKANVERTDRARDVTVNESLTPLDALGKWCMNQGIDEQETAALIAMTAELLEGGVSE